jgi:hypothetical protein
MVVLRRLLSQHGYLGKQRDESLDRLSAVGREFGSPDFDRLMAEDHRNGTGVFDPELKGKFV